MRRSRGSVAAATLVFCFPAGAASLPPPVGQRVLWTVDDARAGRPLQIVAWYPAAASDSGPAFTWRDYLALSLMERTARLLSPGEPEAAAAAFAGSFRTADGVAAAKRWIEAPSAALRNAPPAAGPFPLVVISQGNEQSAFDQAPLAEALAARGYVVATTPSPMRLDGPMQSADEIGARAQTQGEDLAFAVAQVGAVLPADLERIAVVGHSFGARAALLLAMHDPRIRALVSLDGGIGTALGREAMASAPWFDSAGTHAAILHFYEELDPFMAPDFTLLHAVAHGGLELVPTAGMHHHHFTALGFAAAAEPEIARLTGAGPALPASLDGLQRRLFEFLAEHLGATPR